MCALTELLLSAHRSFNSRRYVVTLMVFRNRSQAGRMLAEMIANKYSGERMHILALPRGGVPVGFEVAQLLHASLDVVVSRKIGVPQNPEFGIGAVSEDGIALLHHPTINLFKVKERDINEAIYEAEGEVQREVNFYRQGRPLPHLVDKLAIIVDDGLATGVTAQAAVQTVELHDPEAIVFAAPVCEIDTSSLIGRQVDDVICLNVPEEMHAMSLWYQDFNQLSDEETLQLLRQHRQPQYLQ